MPTFRERLSLASEQNRSLLCVGLDPDPARMPIRDVVAFNSAIVDATRDLVCAYKPNVAFYEARGSEGIQGARAHNRPHPGRCTVGHCPARRQARGYRLDERRTTPRRYFETWDADAATINAYAGGADIAAVLGLRGQGRVRVVPVIERGCSRVPGPARAVGRRDDALLPGACSSRGGMWDTPGAVGLVVGATYPKELEEVRAIAPDAPILLPGVGAQAGFLRASVEAGRRPCGPQSARQQLKGRAVRLFRPRPLCRCCPGARRRP